MVSCIVMVPSTHPDFRHLLLFIRNLICLVDLLTLQAVTVTPLRGDPEQHLASPVTPGVPTSPTCSLITPYRLVVPLLSKLKWKVSAVRSSACYRRLRHYIPFSEWQWSRG